MNKVYKFELKIRGCDYPLHPDMADGVIASQEVTYKDVETIPSEQCAAILFQEKQRFLEEVVEVILTEIPLPEKKA